MRFKEFDELHELRAGKNVTVKKTGWKAIGPRRLRKTEIRVH